MNNKRIISILLTTALASTSAFSALSGIAGKYVDELGNPSLPIGGTVKQPASKPDGKAVYDKDDAPFAVKVNGKAISSNAFYKGNTLMLPVKAIAQKTGWSYSISGDIITLSSAEKEVKIRVGYTIYKINDKKFNIGDSVIDSMDGVYAPWQFFERALDLDVSVKSSNIGVKGYAEEKEISQYTLKVNGTTTNSAPYYSDKVLMIPLRETVMALGYTYNNDADNRQAIFSAKGVNCYIEWDKNKYPVDGKYVKLECAPQLTDGSLYVPSSFIKNALKATVKVSDKKVSISR